MKQLLILGSSFASGEIIENARRRGWHTIVTDNLSPDVSHAKLLSDSYWMISTADTELLEQKCREEGIDAIFAGVSEFNLDRVHSLCRKLNLPCYIEDETWALSRNKRLFKKRCLEKGVPVVQEYPVPDDEDSWNCITYPVVVKPVDGAANAGLSICDNRQELEEGLKKAKEYNSGGEEVIIEEYIRGDEMWNYYFFAEGTPRYVYSGRVFRQPGYPTYLYSFGTNIVDGIEGYLDQIDPAYIELLRDTGCKDGIAWVQTIRDEGGHYFALEMAHRMSADACGRLAEKCLGFNTVDWILDTALGVRHTREMLPAQFAPPYSGAVGVYYLFADHQGKIMRLSGLDKLNPELFLVETMRKTGQEVAQYSLIVKIAYYVRRAGEICSVLEYINRTVEVVDEHGKDLAVRFTDYETVRKTHEGLLIRE